ncbi:hypothetical protein XAC3218_360149 [Xanthomonas citri pv. citri]|nr:hypothetical protein XAC3218_360149 [Xanthomonas citri pv. citri]CEH95365.1 hypothetical protein XACB302_3440002 [Xanthomonas citri pv. citri]
MGAWQTHTIFAHRHALHAAIASAVRAGGNAAAQRPAKKEEDVRASLLHKAPLPLVGGGGYGHHALLISAQCDPSRAPIRLRTRLHPPFGRPAPQ